MRPLNWIVCEYIRSIFSIWMMGKCDERIKIHTTTLNKVLMVKRRESRNVIRGESDSLEQQLNCPAHNIKATLARYSWKKLHHRYLRTTTHQTTKSFSLFSSCSFHCSLPRVATIKSGLLVIDWHSLCVRLHYATLIGSFGWDVATTTAFIGRSAAVRF